MADKAILGGAAFDMAIQAETHVDFMNRHHAVHRFHGSMPFLASASRPDMRLVHELDEIRQGVNPIPANLERWLMIIGPRPRNRLNPAEQRTPMASYASLDRRHTRHRRSSRI